jgi:hypothetical protein
MKSKRERLKKLHKNVPVESEDGTAETTLIPLKGLGVEQAGRKQTFSRYLALKWA